MCQCVSYAYFDQLSLPLVQKLFSNRRLKGPHLVQNLLRKVPEKPGGVHAQEAGGHHQQGEEPHQVLARGGNTPNESFSGPKLFQ